MQRNELTSARSQHSTAVPAPAAIVYELLVDVSGWPVIFPPTIHAESFDLDDGDQRIRLWATANDTVKTWTSLRRLDPALRTIEFRQEVPQEPVAAMNGRWTVKELSETDCLVTLDHEFSAVGDDSAALEWIERAVDTNSGKELAALVTAAARSASSEQLVFEFSDSIEVSAPLGAAYEFIDRADAWRERLPHVADVHLRLLAPDIQLLEMDTVAMDGSTHRTASYRVCFPDHLIVYKQTIFPPFLGGHVGRWSFARSDGKTVVTSSHTVVLDPAELNHLPEHARTVDAAREFVTRALSSNSQATLRRLKDYVEGRTGS